VSIAGANVVTTARVCSTHGAAGRQARRDGSGGPSGPVL